MPPGTASSGSGGDSQDDEWLQPKRSSEDGSASSDSSSTSSKNGSGSDRGSDASESDSSSGEESTTRRVQASGHPRPHLRQTAYLLTAAEAAGRAKQIRPGVPQATAPDAVPAPPLAGGTHWEAVDSVGIEKWPLHWPWPPRATYVHPPAGRRAGGSEGGRANVRTLGHMLDEFRLQRGDDPVQRSQTRERVAKWDARPQGPHVADSGAPAPP
jgi:hypothetical protein